MSYKLNKPCTTQQKNNFIVQYNHNQGMRVEENSNAIYALEAWEILENDTVIDNSEIYWAEQIENEKERIAKLYLTAADVERGIYQSIGKDFDDIISLVTANPPEGLDVKALKIELKANHFYRGNKYVNAVGELLGFTSEQLDRFFQDGDYTHLIPSEDSETNENI